MDHWINASGGNWATKSSWSNGVPTAAVGTAVDAGGTYTVNISTADTTYALILNNAHAKSSGYAGGVLTLAGAGGAQSPNGALSINSGTFVLAGGLLHAGSISVGSGATFLVSNGSQYTGQNAISNPILNNGSFVIAQTTAVNDTGNITGTGSITIESSSNVTLGGNISETGPILIESSSHTTINGIVSGNAFTIENSAIVDITSAITGTAGSFTLMNSANLEFGAAESENIGFAAGASGTLKFDKSALVTGSISGLTPNNKVDLADLTWVSGKMKATFAGNTSGGVLTVTNGTNSINLNLLGNYKQATSELVEGQHGGNYSRRPAGDRIAHCGCEWRRRGW